MAITTNSLDRIRSGSTCYIELQKGPFNGEFWLDDSLNISEDKWEEYKLTELFRDTVPEFDYYGISLVEGYTWAKIISKAKDNPMWQEFIEEISPWANDSFKESMGFSICGM